MNETHEYSLFLIDHDYEEKVIDQVEAYSTITQEDKVIEAISEAEVLTTSVMATNLPKVAPTITKGLKARVKADQEKKLVVMACENAIMGTDILKKAMIETGIMTEEEWIKLQYFQTQHVESHGILMEHQSWKRRNRSWRCI